MADEDYVEDDPCFYCQQCKRFHSGPRCATFSEDAFDYNGEEVDG